MKIVYGIIAVTTWSCIALILRSMLREAGYSEGRITGFLLSVSFALGIFIGL